MDVLRLRTGRVRGLEFCVVVGQVARGRKKE
jgi:hypothetical protein